jgi:hypothetical protein
LIGRFYSPIKGGEIVKKYLQISASQVLIILCIITVFFGISGCNSKVETERSAAQLLISLPKDINTPGGAPLDAKGNIILSVLNFNNGALLKANLIEKPAPQEMVKIDKNNKLTTWYVFRQEICIQ